MTPTQPPPTHTDTPQPHIWGDVKKTSPMEGEVFFTGDRHTDGHCDSMTESAQWADSVKKKKKMVELVGGESDINGAYPV